MNVNVDLLSIPTDSHLIVPGQRIWILNEETGEVSFSLVKGTELPQKPLFSIECAGQKYPPEYSRYYTYALFAKNGITHTKWSIIEKHFASIDDLYTYAQAKNISIDAELVANLREQSKNFTGVLYKSDPHVDAMNDAVEGMHSESKKEYMIHSKATVWIDYQGIPQASLRPGDAAYILLTPEEPKYEKPHFIGEESKEGFDIVSGSIEVVVVSINDDGMSEIHYGISGIFSSLYSDGNKGKIFHTEEDAMKTLNAYRQEKGLPLAHNMSLLDGKTFAQIRENVPQQV